jgi:hypothetical protein
MFVNVNEGFGGIKFFDRLAIKIASKVPVIKTNSKFSMALGPVIIRGKVWNKSIEAHEREHVAQQLKYPFGLFAWIIRYKVDKKFRWDQEKKAINVQIETAAKMNIPVNWADLYSSYLNDYNKMVSHQELTQFVKEMRDYYYSVTKHY